MKKIRQKQMKSWEDRNDHQKESFVWWWANVWSKHFKDVEESWEKFSATRTTTHEHKEMFKRIMGETIESRKRWEEGEAQRKLQKWNSFRENCPWKADDNICLATNMMCESEELCAVYYVRFNTKG